MTYTLPPMCIDQSVFSPHNAPIYQFGCGRYLPTTAEAPCAGLRAEAGQEMLRYGKKALVIGGPTALSLTREALHASMTDAGVTGIWKEHRGHCSTNSALELLGKEEYDMIVGVGGGRMMDLAKLCGHIAKRPVVNIPTSTATCAAVTSLSVLYSDEGKTIGTLCYDHSVESVIADTALLLRQPKRLAAAGILDAMAKKIEIAHYHIEDVGLDAARILAEGTFSRLSRTEEISSETVYLTMPLTGVISGVARGRNQSNLGHGIYEAARKIFTVEAADALHGELVAIGLKLQLAYDGKPEEIPALLAVMRRFHMPLSLPEAGIPGDEPHRAELYHAMCKSPYFVDTDANRKRLLVCLEEVWR